MTRKEGLENPFGPGGAYSGGASFVAKGADLRSPQATQDRRLKNLELAIYGATRQYNNARQQAQLPPVVLQIHVQGEEVQQATAPEQAGNPFVDYIVDELMGFAVEVEFGGAQQEATLRRYLERIRELTLDRSEPTE